VADGKKDGGLYVWRTKVTNSRYAGPEHGPRFKNTCGVFGASSSCTHIFFFLHPHNFLNPEIGLNILFEKGHRGYRK